LQWGLREEMWKGSVQVRLYLSQILPERLPQDAERPQGLLRQEVSRVQEKVTELLPQVHEAQDDQEVQEEMREDGCGEIVQEDVQEETGEASLHRLLCEMESHPGVQSLLREMALLPEAAMPPPVCHTWLQACLQ
jgi:hypothetical protein